MLKVLVTFICFIQFLFAGYPSGDEKELKAWKEGFIVGFKATKKDSKLQGIESKPIETKKYILYFDADKDKVPAWDILMVQMIGYSSMLQKPIRTTNDWIIFASYDDKATALAELERLNAKLFKNAKDNCLKLFINDESKVFYNDKTILYSEIKELDEALRIKNKLELEQKKRELEANQKVGIVFVDKKDNTVIGKLEDMVKKKETFNFSNSKVKSEIIQTPLKDIKEEHPISKIKEVSETSSEYDMVSPSRGADVPIFSSPHYNPKRKIDTLKVGDSIAVLGKNKYGWYKLVKGGYIAAHLVEVTKQKISAGNSKKIHEVKPKLAEKPLFFKLSKREVFFYKLNTPTREAIVDISNFSFAEFNLESAEKYRYERIIKDTDGVEYIQFYHQNLYVEKNDSTLLD